MPSIRPAAVAGSFYPGYPDELTRNLAELLAGVPPPPPGAPAPKALVVPHAGYRYSGSTAAAAYRRLQPHRDLYRRVVLLGPVHRVPVRGVALSDAGGFETPLGTVPLAAGIPELLSGLSPVGLNPGAHGPEHSLEVQLPFLQKILGTFELVPLAVGEVGPQPLAEILDRLWGGPETLIVVSTDLSHYQTYDRAVALDRATAADILALRFVSSEQACGSGPLNGFLAAARSRGLDACQTALNNSGDTAGNRDRVVGYGSFVFAAGGEP